jgi:putative ABC transport system permease protein
MVCRLALRNVLAYKRRTLLIGVILAFGALVLSLGSIVSETIGANLRARYIESFTADVIISADAYPAPNLAPALAGGGGMMSAPEIPDFESVLSFVSAHPAAKSWSPQLQAIVTATVKNKTGSESNEATGVIALMGIDPDLHEKTFPGQWEMVSGLAPSSGDTGLWVPEESMEMLSGDTVLLSCLTPSAGIKVREVEIRGVFRWLHPDPQLSRISYIDALSLQLLLGMNLTASSGSEADGGAIVSTENPEALFSGSLFEEGSKTTVQALDPDGLVGFVNSSPPIEDSVQAVPRYHFLLVRLTEGASFSAFAGDIDSFAGERGIPLRVTDWTAGAGNFGRMVREVQTVFSFLILAVILVSLFVITNSLVLSVTERIPEIGTLRALGGQKGFIRGIVMVEVAVIGLAFGLAGTALGAGLAAVINRAGVALSGMFLQALLGGDTVRLMIGAKSLFLSLGVVAAAALAAGLYPLAVALKIRPVQAMSRR